MSGKIIVCRCEDVTRADVEGVVAKGYRDLEELKRYTGFGTGPCQGKECHALVACELARACANAPGAIAPFTARPPLSPTPLRLLARDPTAHRYADDLGDDCDPDVPGIDHVPRHHREPLEAPPPVEEGSPIIPLPDLRPPLPKRAEVVIIGGGVMGLSIAYQLAKRGLTDVVVVDRGYLAEGASGRNGGGVRAQWSSNFNIELMRQSIELCSDFAVELGVNVWFRQGGYLFLARTLVELARFTRNAKIQNDADVRTQIISPEEACRIVPQMTPDGIVGAAFNPDDGIVFPWPFLWGYAGRAEQLGTTIATHTPVLGLTPTSPGFIVHTSRGDITARRVINACGAGSPAIAAMVGVNLPTWPVRHEICSSEPLKPFLGPMVSEPGTGLYFSQSMRGEIVGGISAPGHGASASNTSTLSFLGTYARRMLRVAPRLGNVKILRQWAGSYDESPDGSPLLGASAAMPDFFLVSGFVGRGFMMAPIMGKLYADLLTGEPAHDAFTRWHVDRFADGATPKRDEDFDIG